MKNLTFLLLFLTLFTACKEQNPKYWLSQIKNEEAKKRTVDVLEKIYVSTVYSVVEKDSLSALHVQFANCKLSDTTKSITEVVFDPYYNKDNELSAFLNTMYQKDSLVAKAALHIILDTNNIDLGRYYNSYEDQIKYSIKIEKKPSKKLEEIENELLSYLEVYPYQGNNREDSINQIKNLLAKALQQANAYEYGLPKFVEKNGFLFSKDEKFRLYPYVFGHGDSKSAYSYIHYRSSDTSKSIFKQLQRMNAIPQLVFQLDENHYGVFYNQSKIINWHVLVEVYEIKNDKIILCKDCVEGEQTKFYMMYTEDTIFPVYDSARQELSFDKYSFRSFGFPPYWNAVIESTRQPVPKKQYERERGDIVRRVLKWNGERLISKPFVYCEE